ncbi:MAG: hypothetical protein J6M53_09215 [Bacteroidaceae bacterium]|nr:hypothetical protein [Bacteroidaceae bacterium]
MKKFLTLAAYALLAVALPFTFAACGGDDDDTPDNPDNPAQPEQVPGTMLVAAGHLTGTDGADYLLKTVKEHRGINTNGGDANDEPEISLAYADADANGYRSLSTIWYEDAAKNDMTVISLKASNLFVDFCDNNGNPLYDGYRYRPTYEWNAQGLLSRMQFTKTERNGTKVDHDITASYSGQHLQKFVVSQTTVGSSATETYTYVLTWSGDKLTRVAYTQTHKQNALERTMFEWQYDVNEIGASDSNPAAQWEPQALYGFETLADIDLDYLRGFFYAGLLGKGSNSVPYGWSKTGSSVSTGITRGGRSLTVFGMLDRAGSSSPTYEANYTYVYGGTEEWKGTGTAPTSSVLTSTNNFAEKSFVYVLTQEMSDEVTGNIIPKNNNAFYAELVKCMDQPLRLRFTATGERTMKPTLVMHIGDAAKDSPLLKDKKLQGKWVNVDLRYVNLPTAAITFNVNSTWGDPSQGTITFTIDGPEQKLPKVIQYTRHGNVGVYIKVVDEEDASQRNDVNPTGWTFIHRSNHQYVDPTSVDVSADLEAYHN